MGHEPFCRPPLGSPHPPSHTERPRRPDPEMDPAGIPVDARATFPAAKKHDSTVEWMTTSPRGQCEGRFNAKWLRYLKAGRRDGSSPGDKHCLSAGGVGHLQEALAQELGVAPVSQGIQPPWSGRHLKAAWSLPPSSWKRTAAEWEANMEALSSCPLGAVEGPICRPMFASRAADRHASLDTKHTTPLSVLYSISISLYRPVCTGPRIVSHSSCGAEVSFSQPCPIWKISAA